MYENQIKTLKKISKNWKNQDSQKKYPLRILQDLIENGITERIRIDSIKLILDLKLKSQEIYKILENCLLSDDNPNVRGLTAKILLLIYPKECKNIIKWALRHETSPSVLKIIQDLSYAVNGHKLDFLD
ncbi:MAG: hypothetical protein EU548_07475 [Promethearchaeota archaeon]|nr:MAG: hypothetical protein EU548_07475 [Candidatus Lokiarchaeota archaeon]